jgi:putative membrane protein
MSLFSDQECQRIAAAISAAERKTSGEIVAVVTASSESYQYVPFLWAALAALIVPWPLIHFTWITVQWIYLVQLIVFLVLLALLWPKTIRTALVPQSVRHAHAHRRAMEQFLVQNLHTTSGRTGVLIFVSVAEHFAEILADTGIDARVPAGTWQEIVDTLTREIAVGHPADGFVQAIERVGHHLAQHFPPGTHDPDELPNHLIVLDGQP